LERGANGARLKKRSCRTGGWIGGEQAGGKRGTNAHRDGGFDGTEQGGPRGAGGPRDGGPPTRALATGGPHPGHQGILGFRGDKGVFRPRLLRATGTGGRSKGGPPERGGPRGQEVGKGVKKRRGGKKAGGGGKARGGIGRGADGGGGQAAGGEGERKRGRFFIFFFSRSIHFWGSGNLIRGGPPPILFHGSGFVVQSGDRLGGGDPRGLGAVYLGRNWLVPAWRGGGGLLGGCSRLSFLAGTQTINRLGGRAQRAGRGGGEGGGPGPGGEQEGGKDGQPGLPGCSDSGRWLQGGLGCFLPRLSQHPQPQFQGDTHPQTGAPKFRPGRAQLGEVDCEGG